AGFITSLDEAQAPEHVIIAGGGVVVGDEGHQVHAHGSAGDDVDAAALPEAGAARAPGGTAVSTVVDDRAVNDGERGGSAAQGIRGPIPDAAAVTVAAVAPHAAGAAAAAAAAVAAATARGSVAFDHQMVHRQGRHESGGCAGDARIEGAAVTGAADAAAGPGATTAAGAARRLVVGERTVRNGQ